MAKQQNKAVKKELKQTKGYKNPVETLWGKIIIWVLLGAMVGVVILGFIIALINI